MRYVYPCTIVRDEEEKRLTGREAYTVGFPDVYGCNNGGMVMEGSGGDGDRRARGCHQLLCR